MNKEQEIEQEKKCLKCDYKYIGHNGWCYMFEKIGICEIYQRVPKQEVKP